MVQRSASVHSMDPTVKRSKLTMLNMPNEKKELYIYSLNDRLTDSQKLEALIAHRAKNSANVKVLCFERSPHCAHLRAHPEEYVKALREFIV